MRFRNKITGCIEVVTNKDVIEQYEKHTEIYELVETKPVTEKADKKAKKNK